MSWPGRPSAPRRGWRGSHRRIRVRPQQAPARAGGLPQGRRLARRVMWPRAARRNLGNDPTEGEQMKSDSEIREDVINELKWDPKIPEPEPTGVAVQDGAVALTGHVSTYSQRLAATRAAERVYGVRAVANDLEVKLSDAPRDDSDIARAI